MEFDLSWADLRRQSTGNYLSKIPDKIPFQVLEEEPDDYPTDADNDNDVEEHPDAVPLIPHWLFGHDRPPDGPAAIRRSSRATKGKHSNPSHLPRSVIR